MSVLNIDPPFVDFQRTEWQELAESGPCHHLLKTNVCETPMLIGYMRISKADGSQTLDLQRDALISAGVSTKHVYQDEVSGKKERRPGLDACLKALRKGDVLVVWKLDRLGCDLRHLFNTVQDLADRGIGFRMLAGQRS